MTHALRWAAMRAILMFSYLWGTKSQDCVHKPQPFWREKRAEAESSRGTSAYQPNALPLGQTGSLWASRPLVLFYLYRAVTLQTTSGTAIAQTAVLTFDATRFHPNYLPPTGPHIITPGSLSCTQVNTHSDDREKELCESQVAFRGCKATLNREKEWG